MDNRPIGIFDSGLGGLSAVKEIKKILPNERIIYFGDTGRVPYGSKSKETIERYARSDADFLMNFDVKLILAACGTVSAVALDVIKKDYNVPFFGVVDSAVSAAVQRTKTKKIAVIGTSATIKSGIFKKKINENGCIAAASKECPLFVPLIECGYTDRRNPITRSVCRGYLSEISQSGADTLIMGCTHFPIISSIISDFLPGVTLINPSQFAAIQIKEFLFENGIQGYSGGIEYYVSDSAESFSCSASIFLGENETINAKTVKI